MKWSSIMNTKTQINAEPWTLPIVYGKAGALSPSLYRTQLFPAFQNSLKYPFWPLIHHSVNDRREETQTIPDLTYISVCVTRTTKIVSITYHQEYIVGDLGPGTDLPQTSHWSSLCKFRCPWCHAYTGRQDCFQACVALGYCEGTHTTQTSTSIWLPPQQ